METCVRHRPDSRIQNKDLLPIREAYEWKRFDRPFESDANLF